LEEFYGTTQGDKARSTSFGTFYNENYEKNSISNLKLTAKERKYKEIYPQMNQTEINNFIKNGLKVDRSSSTTQISKYVRNNPKTSKIESLKSSLFEESNYSTLPTEGNDANGLKYSSTCDWKNLNTELLFHKENAMQKTELGAYSPKKMKYNQLSSSYAGQKFDYEIVKKNAEKKDDRKLQFKEINEFKDKHPHFQKLKQTVSILHEQNFYQTRFKDSDVVVSQYDLQNISGLKNLDEKQLKAHFAKLGLHAYDINVKCDLQHTKGDVNFKIRNNVSENDFKNLFTKAEQGLKSSGVNLNQMYKTVYQKENVQKFSSKNSKTQPGVNVYQNPHRRHSDRCNANNNIY